MSSVECTTLWPPNQNGSVELENVELADSAVEGLGRTTASFSFPLQLSMLQYGLSARFGTSTLV